MVVAPMLGIAPCPQARPATDNGLLMLLTGPIFCTKQIGERLMEITSLGFFPPRRGRLSAFGQRSNEALY